MSGEFGDCRQGSARCPLLTSGLTGLGGRLTSEPADFQVDEVPAYSASGHGDHFLVKIRKIGLTTQEGIQLLARASDCSPRDIGFAGRKDKCAITTQWLSTPVSPKAPDHEAVEILEVHPHNHKLKIGHLRANRFRIRLVDLVDDANTHLPALLERLSDGFPNYYGDQRFGRHLDSVDFNLNLVKRGRRKRNELRFSASIVQSAMFNLWLGRRVTDQLLDRALDGDILKKSDTGGLFNVEDPPAEQLRIDNLLVDPTGPIYGPKMRSALRVAGQRESELARGFPLGPSDWTRLGRLGAGSRRVARIRPADCRFEIKDHALVASFTLPPGVYATVFLQELTQSGDALIRGRHMQQ